MEEKLVKGLNCWPGLGISGTELASMLNKKSSMSKQEANDFIKTAEETTNGNSK